jgi:hypothetical protein
MRLISALSASAFLSRCSPAVSWGSSRRNFWSAFSAESLFIPAIQTFLTLPRSLVPIIGVVLRTDIIAVGVVVGALVVAAAAVVGACCKGSGCCAVGVAAPAVVVIAVSVVGMGADRPGSAG